MSSGRGGVREGAGRKSAWRNGETQTIRVPKVLVVQLLEIAKRLDEGEAIEFVSQSKVKPKIKNESVSKSSSKLNDTVTDSTDVMKPLSGLALGRRLGFSEKAIRFHRDKGDPAKLAEWTQSKDPDGVAWEYWVKTKKYHPSELLPLM